MNVFNVVQNVGVADHYAFGGGG